MSPDPGLPEVPGSPGDPTPPDQGPPAGPEPSGSQAPAADRAEGDVPPAPGGVPGDFPDIVPLSPSGELQAFEQHGVPTPPPLAALAPFHAVDRAVAWVEQGLLIVLVAAMMLLGTSQVVMRQGFNTGLPWADPVLRHMVLIAGMIGAMVATRSGRHLNMDALARVLPRAVRRWVDVAVNLAAGSTCAYLAWVAVPFIQDEIGMGDHVVGPILTWHVQLIFPIAFGVMAYRFLLFATDGLLGGQPQSHAPQIG